MGAGPGAGRGGFLPRLQATLVGSVRDRERIPVRRLSDALSLVRNWGSDGAGVPAVRRAVARHPRIHHEAGVSRGCSYCSRRPDRHCHPLHDRHADRGSHHGIDCRADQCGHAHGSGTVFRSDDRDGPLGAGSGGPRWGEHAGDGGARLCGHVHTRYTGRRRYPRCSRARSGPRGPCGSGVREPWYAGRCGVRHRSCCCCSGCGRCRRSPPPCRCSCRCGSGRCRCSGGRCAYSCRYPGGRGCWRHRRPLVGCCFGGRLRVAGGKRGRLRRDGSGCYGSRVRGDVGRGTLDSGWRRRFGPLVCGRRCGGGCDGDGSRYCGCGGRLGGGPVDCCGSLGDGGDGRDASGGVRCGREHSRCCD